MNEGRGIRRVTTISDLVSGYDDLLRKVQEMLQARHHDEWVLGVQSWRRELETDISTAELGAHAKRTARGLGGMESIGEIAQMDHDERFLALVEALFAKCKEIMRACGI